MVGFRNFLLDGSSFETFKNEGKAIAAMVGEAVSFTLKPKIRNHKL